jgi:hypothetical protein
MLLDSNIIIYAAQPAWPAPAVSVISYIEVLSYHRLSEEEQ